MRLSLWIYCLATIGIILFIGKLYIGGIGVSPLDGQQGTIIDDGLVAISKAAEDELLSYAKAKNTDAIKRLQTRGDLFLVTKGTQITVIHRGLASAEIEINETGRRGIVAVEFITK